jgi:Ras-related protein Rab-6A
MSVGKLSKYKVVLLGADRVGKSALVTTYLYGACDPKYQGTVGVEFHSKTVHLPIAAQPPSNASGPALPWDPISLQLWDCSGLFSWHTSLSARPCCDFSRI